MGVVKPSRRTLHATRWGLLGATLAILVLLNLLGGSWFVRMDLTADRAFTLSDGTRDLLAKLDDDLVVRGYFSAELPPPYNRARQAVKDMLDEYRNLSSGHLRYEFIDPAQLGEAYEQQMAQIGVPMVQVTDVAADKMAVLNGFMGLVLLYEDRQEVLPVVQGPQGLEFMLTSKIRKLTGHDRTVVGIMQGFGAPDMAEEMPRMVGVLGEQYRLMPVNLEDGEPLPDGLNTLLVIAPQAPLTPWALAQIDGFLASGGGLAIMAGGVTARLQSGYAQDLPDLFGELPATWGIEIGHDLVADLRNVRISVSQRQGIFTLQNMVDYPYIPSLIALADDNPVVADLESLFTPFVSTVHPTEVAGLTHTVLAETSDTSWRATAPYRVAALEPFDPGQFTPSARGPHPVAVAVSGTFASVYEGTTVTGVDGDETVPTPIAAPGRLLVVGSGEPMRDTYAMGGENIPFLLNGIDWLAADEGLIGLRSRGVTDRPLSPVSDASRQAIKAANLLAGAVLLILVGLVRWRLRRGRRQRLLRSIS